MIPRHLIYQLNPLQFEMKNMFKRLTCQGLIHNRFLLSLFVVGYIFTRPIAHGYLRKN